MTKLRLQTFNMTRIHEYSGRLVGILQTVPPSSLVPYWQVTALVEDDDNNA